MIKLQRWIHSSLRRIDRDPLHVILRLMGYDVNKFFIQVLFVTCALYLEVFNVVFIVHVFMDSQLYLRQYITFFFLTQPGCTGLLFAVYHVRTPSVWKKLVLENFWSPNKCGPSVESRILWESRIATIYCIVQTIYCIIAHILFCPMVGDESSIIYTIWYIDETFGKWAGIFKLLTYLTFIVSFDGLAAIMNGAVYIALHLRFQLYLLRAYVDKIVDDDDDEENPDQEVIFKRISTCIAHHVKVHKVAKRFMMITNSILLMLHVTGTCAVMTCAYFIFTDVSPKSNFRVAAGFVIIVMYALVNCHHWQRLIDESNNFCMAIINLPWIYWNNKNKKALLLLLMNSQKPLRISCYGIVDIDYNFLLRFARVVYSLLAIVVKMK